MFTMQANLKSKLTHSAQTNLSHYKRENYSQVYEQRLIFFLNPFVIFIQNFIRQSATQTKKDGSSSVPRPAVYISGLRGKQNFDQVTLTLSNEIHNNITT